MGNISVTVSVSPAIPDTRQSLQMVEIGGEKIALNSLTAVLYEAQALLHYHTLSS
jgi:hypothetical protein